MAKPSKKDRDKRRYRKIYVRIWREPKFRGLSSDLKTVTLYLLTGPQTNRIGCYCLSPPQAADDLNLKLPAFLKHLDIVCRTFEWQWDREARVLFIPSWWEWNPVDNQDALIGYLSDRHEVPPCHLLSRCIEQVFTAFPLLCVGMDIIGVDHPHAQGVAQCVHHPGGHQEQEKEKDQEQEKEQETVPPAPSRFPDHPTRAELRSMGTLTRPIDLHVHRHGPVDVTERTHQALRQKAAVRLGTDEPREVDAFLEAFYANTEAIWRAAKGVPPGKSWEVWFAAYDAAYASTGATGDPMAAFKRLRKVGAV